APDTGNVWQRPRWRRYDSLLWTLDSSGAYRVECDEMIQSWDMTFKDTKGSDFGRSGLGADRRRGVPARPDPQAALVHGHNHGVRSADPEVAAGEGETGRGQGQRHG